MPDFSAYLQWEIILLKVLIEIFIENKCFQESTSMV